MDTLAGSKYFTMLDLASGYWQVEVAKEDQPKMVFTTPQGLFQFQVMPLGLLCNVPAHLPAVSGQSSTCLVYFDKIIVVRTSFADHLSNIGGGILAQLCVCVWGGGGEGGRAEVETRKVPSLPETCWFYWTYVSI